LPDLSGKKCWSFDVSEITGTDGSLILILARWKTGNSGPPWILKMFKNLSRRLFDKSNNHTKLIMSPSNSLEQILPVTLHLIY